MDCMISRRSLLMAGTVLAVAQHGAVAAQSAGELDFPTPDIKKFSSGDLIWPKKQGAFVPYNSGNEAIYDEERLQWEGERDDYVKARKSDPTLTPEEDAQLDLLDKMEFARFLAMYQADEVPDVPGLYATGGGRGLYVGHVGIIELDNQGVPWVIEALWKKGVVRHTYASWLAGRPNELVWHGRINGLLDAQGNAIAAEAKKHVGKPYKFWNFDLGNDSGFYCSKLAWLSIYRATGIAIDGKPKMKRGFWFSPKQLLYVERMNRLHDPGNYGST